ncbi:hypothetical protein AVEN_138001-1 [Araneus ventricosus]|uniref:Uncharacterized protein n=1 Tax=Araneus ventricosus TaxID=182803 RepID=A0A4Y2WYL4_ARAVE|nr:hypothetical protein AVEN_113711-1 [Araneus ventricosus]GBO42495.1 hypothetical protein AVEN_138001-1 [Araneus ventricosus]
MLYSSKDLQNSNFVIDCKMSIHFLHAISGCGTTSGLYGKGKLQAVKLLNRSEYLQDFPEIFNNPKSTYSDIERAGERFIIASYNNTKKEESSLNDMRYDCFNKLVGQASSAVPVQVTSNHRSCTSTLPSHIPSSTNKARTVFEPIELGMEVSE